ncbi:putative fimbrial protein [Pectobacterium atrosepticum SCRI1043]|uniref:Fimbrial protein n=1 Tax=Pectobacterium atrosepticum (strain SCRI 1043 / ATCC BAA-672) TaxID=218491 RepID=Q6D8N3_PECAS|nr:fimbrial protein [Pectobacterium atrosepticum]GKV86116.1 fimbrial protein BcfA [Pectobacterium carotovorum subsp. carotovorum]AIA69832.1 fimbrial protein [Pectobacterium atrosepticum]AIK12744.1 putative fimbrial protein [Pectobacterium atrosepticum]ATY89750.1 type 1 fimbrial protein [Pectobacterium atrosepticum]KFX11908.1 fimbrial protein [Pectobacterium atrosepticum]
MIKNDNTVIKARPRGAWLAFTLGILTLPSGSSIAQQISSMDDHEVTFHVLVVNAACNVSSESKAIVVNMSEVSDRYLKANSYGDWHDFTINLTDCNLDTYQNATIRFSGKEEPLLPKRLALDTPSGAKGIAIGIYHENKLVGINNSTGSVVLQSGDNAIPFSARIEKIRDDLIQSGDFVATANFTLSYL